MKLIILLMVASLFALIPFVVLRRPWALKIWRRIKLIAVIYAVIIATAGTYRLIVNWDSIFG